MKGIRWLIAKVCCTKASDEGIRWLIAKVCHTKARDEGNKMAHC